MQAATTDCWDAQRWGLVPAAIDHLTEALRTVWQRYQACFQTQTHNGNAKAWVYLRGLLTMDEHRTFANIARRVQGVEADGQDDVIGERSGKQSRHSARTDVLT